MAEPQKLNRFLDTIYSKLDMDISIKTRIGTHYEEDWDYLLDIYSRYPIKELIIHPRIQADQYRNTPRYEAFQKARKCLRIPLCYNGDLFTITDYGKLIEAFPDTSTFMFGRGLIANPGLVTELRDHKKPGKHTLKAFHDRLYHNYRENMSGDRNVLFRMKELWSFMAPTFTNYEKYAKKIKKAQRLADYDTAVSNLFAEQELKE